MKILYTKNKRLIITTSYLVSIWLLLEYYLDRKVRKNLKYISSIKNIHPLDSNTVKTIYNDLSRCQSHERIHLINSMKSTFVLSSPDLNSVYFLSIYIQEGVVSFLGISIIKLVLHPQEPFASGLSNLRPLSIKL